MILYITLLSFGETATACAPFVSPIMGQIRPSDVPRSPVVLIRLMEAMIIPVALMLVVIVVTIVLIIVANIVAITVIIVVVICYYTVLIPSDAGRDIHWPFAPYPLANTSAALARPNYVYGQAPVSAVASAPSSALVLNEEAPASAGSTVSLLWLGAR